MKKIKLILLITLFMVKITSVSASSNLNCNNTLSYNSNNNQVKILQTKLNKVMTCNLVVDGIFGYNTNNCVIQFQKKYNLTPDGIIGNQTCTKLNSIYQKENKKKYVVITAETLNVRTEPTTNSTIIKTVKRGKILRIYGTKKTEDNIWYKVKGNKATKYGYISEKYAKKTIILLNITNQQLTFYKKGKILINAPVVTGMKNSHDTPIGYYTIHESNKTTNTTLTGTNDNGSTYNSFVNYWMPFILERGIGFHDASWRNNSEFNNQTYQYNGSHGCVNMRFEDAKTLYENIKGTIPIIII